MKKLLLLNLLLFISTVTLKAQNDTIKLKEVNITSNRIELPFSKTSHTITVISAKDIENATSTNLPDLLQNTAGIDIRRRGIDGMQADLYIRGGNFDQTLVLIDGVKMDDPQTGHHSMNAALPLEIIERIEIIKGPTARIYGQNAFTGAINIITKQASKNKMQTTLNYGSFNNKRGIFSLSNKLNNGNIFSSVSYQESEGYRYNTDFKNIGGFVNANLKNYQLMASFTQRKFGANGFYASPAYKDQYEETQTSLIAVSSVYNINNLTVKPRIYWRRNEDMYLFLRDNPSYYRNLHISNKVGAETNIVFSSKLGQTGVGLDISRVYLVSNNLGNHQRTAITGFIEHRFEFGDFDITPGVAISNFSDYETNAFPGLDIGYRFSEKIKIYGNMGYTYRVPTFTDLYYVGPTTLGNQLLKPESAFSEELGMKLNLNNLKINVALFHRKSDNLIDWTKDNEADKWEARNFSNVVTQGVETDINYSFTIGNYKQLVKVGYSFINDDIKDNNVVFTQYSLNSLKHQVNIGLKTKFTDIFSQQVSYRFVERTLGQSYNIVDAKLSATISNNLILSLNANNIFNASYTETNLLPMPKGNVLIGLQYKI